MRWSRATGLLLSALILLGVRQLGALDAAAPGEAFVRNAAELVAALNNTAITLVTLVSDIRLTHDEFPLLRIERNITVRGGTTDPATWRTLDLNYTSARVQLVGPIWITLMNIVADHFSTLPMWQSPGIDLISSDWAQGTGGDGPILLIENAAFIQRPCLPLALLQAAAAVPQVARCPAATTAVVDVAQEGCSNSSSASAGVRCWASKQGLNNSGLAYTPTEATGLGRPANYSWCLRNGFQFCSSVVTDECIRSFGGIVACYYYMQAAESQESGAPADGASPPTATPAPDQLGGSTAASGSSRSSSSTLVGAVVGAVGGAALIALIVVGLLLLRRRRRDAASKGGASSAESPQVPATSHTPRGGSSTTPSTLKGQAESGSNTINSRTSASTGSPYGGSLQGPQRQETARKTFGSAAASTQQSSPQSRPLPDALAPVTPLTPYQPGLDLNVQMGGDGGELQLLEETLGKGNFGRVVKGRYRGQLVAVKLLDTGLMPNAVPHEPPVVSVVLSAADGGDLAGNPDAQPQHAAGHHANVQTRALRQEVEVLARCRHPCIVQLLAANLTPPRLCLVMELMETTLERMIYGSGRSQPLELPVVLHIAGQVADALSYLHPTVLHRDLKPANILIREPNSPRPVVKLGDFGISRLLMTALVTANPEAGTAAYMANETFDLQNAVITDRVDIYSLAIVMWEMLSGTRPWADCGNVVAVAYRVSLNAERPPLGELDARCPEKLLRLMSSMWAHEPARRPAAAEVSKTLLLIAQDLSMKQQSPTEGPEMVPHELATPLPVAHSPLPVGQPGPPAS